MVDVVVRSHQAVRSLERPREAWEAFRSSQHNSPQQLVLQGYLHRHHIQATKVMAAEEVDGAAAGAEALGQEPMKVAEPTLPI